MSSHGRLGTTHARQASTHGVIKLAKKAVGGTPVIARTRCIAKRSTTPPSVPAIVAGSKVSTKLEMLSSRSARCQRIVGAASPIHFIAAWTGVGTLYEAT